MSLLLRQVLLAYQCTEVETKSGINFQLEAIKSMVDVSALNISCFSTTAESRAKIWYQ